MTVQSAEHDLQIGAGSGWVSSQIALGQVSAARALELLKADWKRPGPGLHPREAALAAAREAVLHLNEALSVESPEDAIEDTRHALEQLTVAVAVLDKLSGSKNIAPGQLPIANFETAIDKLVEAQARLHTPVEGGGAVAHGLKLRPQLVGSEPANGDVPHIMRNDNGGIVPPWMQ
jgi:hypothetical protein